MHYYFTELASKGVRVNSVKWVHYDIFYLNTIINIYYMNFTTFSPVSPSLTQCDYIRITYVQHVLTRIVTNLNVWSYHLVSFHWFQLQRLNLLPDFNIYQVSLCGDPHFPNSFCCKGLSTWPIYLSSIKFVPESLWVMIFTDFVIQWAILCSTDFDETGLNFPYIHSENLYIMPVQEGRCWIVLVGHWAT